MENIIMRNKELPPLRNDIWHLFGPIPTSVSVTICAALLTSVILGIYMGYATPKKLDFKNSDGHRIKTIKGETRYRRFSHGLEMSQEGHDMAGELPYLVRNGRIRELVITQPEHVREFYRNDGKDHMKGENLNLGYAFGRLLGQSAGVQGGQRWVAIRSNFDPQFSHKAGMKMFPVFAREIEQWVTDISGNTSSPTSGFVRNAMEACRFMPFRLIALTIYGDAMDDKTYQELVMLNDLHEPLMLDAIFGKWAPFKVFNLLPTRFTRRLNAFEKSWETVNDSVIKNARIKHLHCRAERIYEGVELGQISRAEFLQTMYELLFTNIDVTSTVTSFLLLNISANTAFQSVLREEIMSQKQHSSYDLSSYIEKRDTLLHYAIMESLRMSPALWFSLPEKRAIEKTIGGYCIPAGTPTIIDWRRLNTTPAIWGSDSELFRPERFADISPAAYRYSFLRFGIGSRRCLGQNIALLMLKMVAAEVLGRYVIRPGRNSGIRDDRFTVTSDGDIEFIPIIVGETAKQE